MPLLQAVFESSSVLRPDPVVIEKADNEYYNQYQATPKAAENFCFEEIAAACDVTLKTGGVGINFFVIRQGGETNSQWTKRTQKLSQMLASATGDSLAITTGKGRIVANELSQDTHVYQTLAS